MNLNLVKKTIISTSIREITSNSQLFSYYNKRAISIMKSNLLQKPDFLKKIVYSGRIHGLAVEQTSIFHDDLLGMIEVLNRLYGDNWDFYIEPKFNFLLNVEEEEFEIDFESYQSTGQNGEGKLVFNGFQLSINILYPEVIIKNSDEKEHTIKDLIVNLVFRSQCRVNDIEINSNHYGYYYTYYGSMKIIDVSGTRATQSYEEYVIGYFHSHLSVSRDYNYNSALYLPSFCLGDNDVNDIKQILNENFSLGNFELLLLTIDTMVSWESLEGGPYRYIKNITLGSEKEYGNSTGKEYWDAYYNPDYPGYNNVKKEFNYYFEKDRYLIKKDEKLISFIKNVASYTKDLQNAILVKQEADGTYHSSDFPENIKSQKELDAIFTANNRKSIPYFYLKGRKIKLKIHKHTGKIPDKSAFTIHPSLLEYAAKNFQTELYKKAIRRSSLKRLLNQSTHARTVSAESTVFM